MVKVALRFLKSSIILQSPVAALGFSSSSWLTNVDGMKDLTSYSTARLYAINTEMNGKIYGTLVQFGCYQHRCEWKGLYVLKPPPYIRLRALSCHVSLTILYITKSFMFHFHIHAINCGCRTRVCSTELCLIKGVPYNLLTRLFIGLLYTPTRMMQQ